MKKSAIIVVALVVIALATYSLWSSNGKSPEANAQQAQGGMPPTEVVTLDVKPEILSLYQELTGRTQAFRVAEIRPQVNGIIVRRFFEEGSNVKQGQQLYQIAPEPYQASYNSALADLQKAEANLKSTQAKKARYQELVNIGGVSKQEYDDIVASLTQGQADIAIAKAAVATAKINLDYTKVLSPISGRIGKSAFTEGALVTANQADPLATVQQFDKIYVDVTQSATDFRKLRKFIENNPDKTVGKSVTLTVQGETEAYSEKGEFQFSDVTVDQGTGTVQVRILFDNPNLDLLAGLFVKAKIVQEVKENAILVPQPAVTRNADGSTTVWKITPDNKAVTQVVTLGQAMGDKWLVMSGLNAGDRIVVEGGMKLAPDASVKPVPMAEPNPMASAPAVSTPEKQE